MLLQDKAFLISLDCDLALLQVIPHIDGVKFAKKISLDADVDIEIVKRCLRALLYYNCCALIDIFQYSNRYSPTARAQQVFSCDRALQLQCRDFVTRPGQTPLSLDALVRLYLSFSPAVTVLEVLQRLAHSRAFEALDHRRVITFGAVHGLLQRMHCYPICHKVRTLMI